MRSLLTTLHSTRPLLGGALLVLAGVEIIWADGRQLGLVLSDTSGSTPIVIGGILVVFGILAWVTPAYAPMTGLLAQATAVLAFLAANLGGYVLGSVLGVIGGALVFAWRVHEVGPREVGA